MFALLPERWNSPLPVLNNRISCPAKPSPHPNRPSQGPNKRGPNPIEYSKCLDRPSQCLNRPCANPIQAASCLKRQGSNPIHPSQSLNSPGRNPIRPCSCLTGHEPNPIKTAAGLICTAPHRDGRDAQFFVGPVRRLLRKSLCRSFVLTKFTNEKLNSFALKKIKLMFRTGGLTMIFRSP